MIVKTRLYLHSILPHGLVLPFLFFFLNVMIYAYIVGLPTYVYTFILLQNLRFHFSLALNSIPFYICTGLSLPSPLW